MEKDKIIQQLRGGQNQEALRELYKGFPSVDQFIRQHGGTKEDARDIFQESLLIFYRNAQKEDFTLSCAASTYLFSIAKYLWKDQLRKNNRTGSFNQVEIAADSPDFTEEDAQHKAMDEVLSQLGEKCNEILTLFYYQKKTMEEIAQALDYKNVDTAKVQKYKCLERAKSMVKSQMIHF